MALTVEWHVADYDAMLMQHKDPVARSAARLSLVIHLYQTLAAEHAAAAARVLIAP